ncbi:hypothetical protein INT47_008068 [Mucor saturninus]|uniref:Uncharacterized protein n=1 Tax=Mucor saturninus TaxID=64648 RepID=A0A8H7R9S6_9FUNG|nr:hypothetical protein INT47_008068 [Mucor saturninus]
MRIEEINRDLLCSVSKDFQHHIQKLLEFQNDNIEAFVYICRNTDVLENKFEVLDDELKTLLQTYVNQHYKYNLFSFDKDEIRRIEKKFGADFHLMSQCQIITEDIVRQSCVQRSPKTLPRNSDVQEQCKMVSRSLFENSEPDYMASIDISLESVKYVCGFLGDDNRIKNLTEYSSLDIQPLKSYFQQLDIYQNLVLHTTKRMKNFMEENFDDYLSSSPGVREYPIQSLYTNIPSTTFIESLKKSELASFFSTTTKLENVATTMNFLIPVLETKYTHIVLLMYLAYINVLISVQLDICFGKDWKDKNIGYTLRIEDFFLDNVDICKEDIQQLFYLSSIPQKVVERRKVRLCNIGSCLLPAFQKHIGQEFKSKSFFAIAQLHSTYIHLELNQVVKLDLSGKEMSKALFIEDKIVPIENPILLLSSGSKSSNMDNEIGLNINKDCNCKTLTTLRNIMVGFKPIIENIASMIIAVTLELHPMDYLLIFETALTIEHESMLYKAYAKMLQDEISKAIQLKEKCIQGVVMHKTTDQLLQPVMRKQHPMYSAFKNGDPYNVAGSTYGLTLKKLIVTGIENPYLICINHDDDGTDACIDVGDTVVAIRKGQILSRLGINLKFKIRFKNIQRDNTLLLPCLLELELMKFSSAKNPNESIAKLSLPIDGVIYETCVNLKITSGYHAIRFTINDEISVQHPDIPNHVINPSITVVEPKNIVYL